MFEWDSEADCDNVSYISHNVTSWMEDKADLHDDWTGLHARPVGVHSCMWRESWPDWSAA